jgi:protein phosphatase
MGTTMTAARNLGADLIVAHVGDSRAYLLRGAEFRQLTRDHTLAQDLADRRGIGQADVATHIFRHALTRALGGTVEWKGVDVAQVELADGDRLLLCSDGLTEMVAPPTVAATLRAAPTARAACDALVGLALENGGRDNVTVVVAAYQIGSADLPVPPA